MQGLLHCLQDISLLIDEGLAMREGIDKIYLERSDHLKCLEFFDLELVAKCSPLVRDLVDKLLGVLIT